jgi:cytoskeletal protein CcmA (bactofilin family)
MLEPKDNQNSPKFTPPSAPNASAFAAPRTPTNTMEQATIGRSLVIKGEISGSEALYIDGKVEGTINLSDNRVTVGRNGSVTASIHAREVVVMGKVHGNLHVTDRVDIRSEGSVVGDVAAQRLSIEDGAFIKGSVDLGKAGQKSTSQNTAAAPSSSGDKASVAHA